MNNLFITELIGTLEKNLHISRNNNFIEDLFNDRSEKFHKAITQNKEYKEYMKKINNIDEEITEKFKNRWEIIHMIEKYTNATFECEELCEKLMYKYGVLDGLLLITQGTKQIDIEKFFKENKL